MNISLLITSVGGHDNIEAVIHCATRLRFTLKDDDKADLASLEKIPGVLKAMNSGGQIQVVIGNTVPYVYASLQEELSRRNKQTEELEDDFQENKKPKIGFKQKITGSFNQMINVITSVFSPLLPIMTVGGLIKAFLSVVPLIGFLPQESTTYVFLEIVGDAPFYFLPVLVAYTSSQRFKTDKYLSMLMGLMLMHPLFTGMVTEGLAVHFYGIPVLLQPYGNAVFPSILAVYVLSLIYKWLGKRIPVSMQLFLNPLLALLIMAPLLFIVIGPIGVMIGSLFSQLIYSIHHSIGWLAILILAGVMPFIVLTGMQKAFIPVTIAALTSAGYESVIGPAMLASNFSQGAAALAVYFVMKEDKEMKQLAISTSITAFLAGITEPAMYGVNMKLKYPLYASMIGSAAGGAYVGFNQLKGFAYAIPSVLSMPAWIGQGDYANFWHAVVGVVISVTVTMILTIIFSKKMNTPLN